jgi:hypothetical protein
MRVKDPCIHVHIWKWTKQIWSETGNQVRQVKLNAVVIFELHSSTISLEPPYTACPNYSTEYSMCLKIVPEGTEKCGSHILYLNAIVCICVTPAIVVFLTSSTFLSFYVQFS